MGNIEEGKYCTGLCGFVRFAGGSASINLEMLNKQYDKYKDQGDPAFQEEDLKVVFFRKPKFQEERIAISNERYYFAMDGLILNRKGIMAQYNMVSFEATCGHLLEIKGPQFIKELRGNFFGIIYDRLAKKTFLFVDHMGTKWLFYRHDPEHGLLLFSNKLEAVVQSTASLGQPVKLDISGAYSMLALGYMLDNATLVENIKKVRAGTYLEFINNSIIENQYYRLANTPFIKGNNESIIEELNERFKQAIIQEYEKDKEYGYDHLATMSGGIDSRMNVGVAYNCGYTDITTFTMSQTNYYDEVIAKIIANDMGLKHLSISLGNGEYLEKIEKGSFFQEGLVLYSGSAHLLYALENIDMNHYGMVHTGMLGDVVFGSYLMSPRHTNALTAYKNISPTCQEYLRYFYEYCDRYENAELLKFHARGINAVFNGYRTIEGFTEYTSPFLHVDFIDYALKIHPKLRYNKKIYKEWIAKKHNNLTKYPLESRFGMSFDSPEIFVLVKRAIRKIRRKCLGPSWNDSMNPMEYWYKRNNALRVGLQSYFDKNIEVIADHDELTKETRRVFSSESVPTKTKALTLLSAVRNLGLK